MARIFLLDSDDAASFGLAVAFDDGKPAVLARWRHAAPLTGSDCLQLAKDCAARVLDHLMRKGRNQEAEFTNWPSVVAAMQRHISDVNDKVRAAAYAAGERVAGKVDAQAAIELQEIEGGGLAGGARIH